MRWVWGLAVVLAGFILAVQARADTLYLKDGESVWGTDIYEEGDTVIVVRPGGELKFPKTQVRRIERLRSTLPPFYATPEASPAPATPPGTGAPGAPVAPGPPGGGAAGAPSAGGGAGPSTPGTGPTQLPPPPPPPAPPGMPR